MDTSNISTSSAKELKETETVSACAKQKFKSVKNCAKKNSEVYFVLSAMSVRFSYVLEIDINTNASPLYLIHLFHFVFLTDRQLQINYDLILNFFHFVLF